MEKQAEVARIFLKNREELKTLDINVFLLENSSRRQELKDAETDVSRAEEELADTKRRHEESTRLYDELQTKLEALDAAIEEARERITDSSVKREKLEGQIGILTEQIRQGKSDAEHFDTRKRDQAGVVAAKEEELRGLQEELEAVATEARKFDEALQKAVMEQAEITKKATAAEESIEEYKSRLIEQLNDRAAIRSRLSSLDTRAEQAKLREAELTGRLVRARSDESRQEEVLEDLRGVFKSITEEITRLNEEQKAAETELSGMKDRLASCDVKLREATAERQRVQSRLEALANLTERYEGYGGSVKRVMELKGKEPGIIGVVADIIKTDKKYETAIEVALGGSIQNIVTTDEETAKRAISFLKETRSGRATFLPLSGIENPRGLSDDSCLRERGVIGTADTLVETEARYANVARTLLGRIVVVQTIDDAIRIERAYHHSLRMVTLEGELLTPGGAISGGAFKNTSNLLGRRREMDELERQVRELTDAEKAAQQAIDDTKSRRNELRTRIEEGRTTLQEKFIEQNTARLNVQAEEERQEAQRGALTDLKKESGELEEEVGRIEAERASEQERLAASEALEQEYTQAAEELRVSLEELRRQEDEKAAVVSEARLSAQSVSQKADFHRENVERVTGELKSARDAYDEIIESIAKGAALLAQREQDLETVRGTIEASREVQSDADRELNEKRAEKDTLTEEQKQAYRLTGELAEAMSGLEREVTRLHARCERCREAIESRINYMWEEYEITLSDAEGMRDETMDDLPRMKSRISALKDENKKLGDVNVGAIEEYRTLMERYTFLKTQHDDLIRAQEELSGIIQELDESMRSRFMEQFARIQREFDTVFKEMFGGGTGTLELVEGEDILTAGIRVIAQPPGKKLQNMMQLSGGEKALTAIALLFAIQALKPSPFCLLDEIEAALDENNVVRFAGFLHKLEDTQFIVITHRRGTMESADRLYGITMQEKGVSTLVSVNLIDKELS